MALINCHECGKQVSTDAKTCPSCGASVKKQKKPVSKYVWALVGIAVISGSYISTQKQKEEADRVAAMTPEQVAQAKVQKDKEAQTLGMAVIGAKILKKSSKDPKTFEYTSIVMHPNSSVCYEYRAQNSFSAILAGSAVLVNGKLLVQEHDKNIFVTAWNKNCTTSDGEDVMGFVARKLESS